MTEIKPESVPENKKGFTINASPLNPVKFELGIVLIIGILLLVINEFLTDSLSGQFLILGAYSLISMVWLVLRARKVVKHNSNAVNGNG